jgi:hypothetical protein
MSPYFSRLAQRSFAAPSRSLASDASVDSASDWNEHSDTIAAAPALPTTHPSTGMSTGTPAFPLAAQDIAPVSAGTAVIESAATMANSVAAVPTILTVPAMPAMPAARVISNIGSARVAEPPVTSEAKAGELPHRAESTAGPPNATRQDRRSTGSDTHAIAATWPDERLPPFVPGDRLSDIDEQSTFMSPAIAMTPPRLPRADASTTAVAIDADDNMPAAPREAASMSRPSRSSARASSTAQAQPEPARAAVSASKSPDTIDVHIGRVDIEVAAAPARQTILQRPAPPAAAPPRRSPATTFNPHRHYLRSR